MLGYIVARPLNSDLRKHFPLHQSLIAGAVTALSVLLAIWQVKGIGSELTIPEQYFRVHSTYLRGEAENLQLWNQLAQRAGSGSMSDAELRERFERDILPFWQTQRTQLEKENETLKGPQREFALLVQSYADLRYQWATALIDSTNNHHSDPTEALRFMKESLVVQAKLERIGIRSRMDHRPRALAATAPVMWVRQLFAGAHCVTMPPVAQMPEAASDNPRDGPATRHAMGCRAQQLFMAGDYRQLDSLLNQSMKTLEDLPDGSSRYEGMIGGLADLFRNGRLDVQVALGHTADWRRQVKGSGMADLVEAMLLSDWRMRRAVRSQPIRSAVRTWRYMPTEVKSPLPRWTILPRGPPTTPSGTCWRYTWVSINQRLKRSCVKFSIKDLLTAAIIGRCMRGCCVF